MPNWRPASAYSGGDPSHDHLQTPGPLSRSGGGSRRGAGQRQIVIANAAVDNGFKMVPSILEDVVVVDKANLAATVIKDGFHKAEDLR